MYRYYSTQRPVMPGTYPAEKKVSEIVNFSERKYVTNISREAWGDRKSTRLNSSHKHRSRMPSSA